MSRRRTINAKGEVIEQPYGVGRWHSMRVRDCTHDECLKPAVVLKRGGECKDKAHNCCGEHSVQL